MIKIITVDASAIIRSIEKQIFSSCKDFNFLSSVSDYESLISDCKKNIPDIVIISSDIDDLKKSVKTLTTELNIPVVIFKSENYSSQGWNSVTEIDKPDFVSMSSKKINDFLTEFCLICKNLIDKSKCSFYKNDNVILPKKNDFKILLIGVSTGGPKSLKTLLESFDKDFPVPILITQHIDYNFDKNMVAWLDSEVSIPVSLAMDGLIPQNGHAYLSPADCHLTLEKKDDNIVIVLDKGPPINFLRPAVDKMFTSAAEIYKEKCVSVLLTGMGNDDTDGCKKIKSFDGYTIAESEETCVIYGMPKAAYDAGVIDEMIPLYEIGNKINQLFSVRSDK